jgi:hypothetical protein
MTSQVSDVQMHIADGAVHVHDKVQGHVYDSGSLATLVEGVLRQKQGQIVSRNSDRSLRGHVPGRGRERGNRRQLRAACKKSRDLPGTGCSASRSRSTSRTTCPSVGLKTAVCDRNETNPCPTPPAGLRARKVEPRLVPGRPPRAIPRYRSRTPPGETGHPTSASPSVADPRHRTGG